MSKSSALGRESRLRWCKSSYSGTSGNCVEVAVLPNGARAVRDSKNLACSVLIVAPAQWGAFTAWLS